MSVKLELIKATSYDSGITNNGKSTMNVLMKSDCRKFAPNIFNKSKCQNCFKTKDAHSAEALECNRATRKIAKCGYLFVAPDWDFSISINRTKRWQRRWFVLYDDGELTYSVDEHPNTIPQALIDMNKVLEVTDAEQLTGNQYSLAIRAIDRVHFVKGTSRDETKWWCDLLSHYSHGTVRGRLKRNTTFPGVITTTNTNTNTNTNTTTNNNNVNNSICDLPPEKQTVEQLTNNFNETVSNNNNNINNKNLSGGVELEWRSIAPETSANDREEVLNNSLGHSYHGNTSNRLQQISPDNSIKPEDLENLNNLIITSLTNLPTKKMSPDSTQEQENVVPKENNNLSKPEKLDTDPSKSRSRRYVKRESRGLRSQRSRSDGVAKMIPSSGTVSSTSITSRTPRNIHPEANIVDDDWSSNCIQNPLYLLSADGPNLSRIDMIGKDKLDGSPLTGHRRRHASSGQELVRESKTEARKAPSARDLLLGDHSKESPKGSPLLIRRHSFNRKVRTYDDDCEVTFQGVVESTPKRGSSLSRNNSLRKDKDLLSQVRGDPDGCLPNSSLPNPEEQLEMKDGSTEKNGWLFRYGMHKEWFKHWFVLKKSMLCYFRDPSAEVSGIMDGVLDLGLVKDVQELASDTNHAFTITTWDNKKHVLAASKASVRSDWVRAIAAAANLRAKSVFRDEDRDSIIQDIEKLNLKLSSHLEAENLACKEDRNPDPAPDCASSTSSDDHSEYFSVVDEDDLAERSALPPSPPVNRTAISRVKQKARSRSSSRSRSKRKLRSSSDLGSTSSFDLGGDSNDADSTIVPEDCDATHETKEKPIVKTSGQNLLVAQINDDSKSGNKPTGNHRHLLDKYNILRKELDLKRPGDLDKVDEKTLAHANDALVENIFKLMKDCKSFLSRLRETLRSKNEGELRLPIMELSLQWKEIKAVCTKLDSILCKLSGVDDENEAVKSENPDLSIMVEKAREEIKRLKKDLKASQDSFDDLELHCYKLKQDMNNADDLHKSHMSLMTARVDDLTSKLTASERSLRLAKQRVAKLEARQERRRSSLKGKEAVSLSKEFEGKLSELEQKIGSIETSLRSNQSDICDVSQDKNKEAEVTSSSIIDTSATGMLLRLHSLHTKVSAASVTASEISSATSSPPNELAGDLACSPPPMLPPAQLPLEKPKICLQVKGGGLDESSGTGNCEDAIENWSSLSVTTSMSDLHTIEPDEEPPGNLEECLNVLSQKLDILLSWLQSSVQNLTTEDSILVNSLPDDQLKVAKILEEYLSTQLGGDESTINSVSYLTLLRKAVTMINSVVHTHSLTSNQSLKNNELARIRLKKLSKAIEQNLKLDSDFENSIHLLEEMILVKGDDLNSDNYFEYSENVIENLKNFRHWKIEEVLLPKTYCDVPVKDSDYSGQQENSTKLATDIPIDRLRSGALAILNGFLFNNGDGAEESNHNSKEKIMVLIDSELTLLKKDLDKKIGELDSEEVKEDIENVALVGVLERLGSFVLQNVVELQEGEEIHNLNNAVLSLIEALVARWSLQLLAKSLVCVSTDLKKKSKEVSQLKRKIQCLEEEEEQRKLEPCVTCRDLQKQVCRLQTDLRACQRRMGQGGVPCERCRELHRRMEILSERHQMELSSSLEREREEHREELRNRIAELTVVREMEKNADREEVAKLKQELKVVQNQAQVLKEQFDEQLRSLREVYEEKINLSEKSVEFIGEAVLQKYQSEMEDLKGLCEKGLLAVDQCHRRELTDLTQKQRKEIQQLKDEKERALAEESQATATVVEALKRSHREEMERELTKLKEELLFHADTPKDSNLEEIKQEILQLSEKYSRKCLEHSALEEKLNILSQQMQQTNHQMLDLLARNRQLQAHLTSDLAEKRDQIQLVSSETGELDPSENMAQLKKLLVLRESELVAEREEKARVNQQLIQARNELTQQDIRCRQLDQGLRMQRRLWLGQAGALKNRLEAIATAASSSNVDAEDYKSHLLGYKGYLTSNTTEDRMRFKPRRTTSFTSLVPRELLRSPSCPGLATTPSSSLT